MNAKLEWFKQTSDGLYDRHDYKIVTKTGKEIVVDNWDTVYATWFQKGKVLSHIEVLDKDSKGFK